ncbi:hypothetical protein AWW66_27195 [Micromonospora rosaria]|uniref:Fibronectin type-III domain-containing protein n=1 Tax=Micromonospora rosaria TaxID=47874 RepID=A0A136PKE3_9ACTN|nr:fibronectin type III domain-containing protein [Micromonospora rosaria]KXK58905.1 hypothetical protein AWW66_27195 [Micromonospora rosaria]
MRAQFPARLRTRPGQRALTAVTTLTMVAALAAVASGRPAAEPGAPRLVSGPVDITDTPGTITDQYGTTGAEGVEKVVDNSPYRKYFTGHSTGWIQFVADTPATVTGYAVTSANDAPDRNPRSWVFEASTGTGPWTALDTRSDQTFLTGFETKTFSFANTQAYRHYRLRITGNDGSPDLQLAEWRIFGTTTATTPAPGAPTGFQATGVSGDQVLLTWTDTTRWETTYRLERSTGGGAWTPLAVLPTATTRYRDLKLPGGSTYQYRLRAENAAGVTGWVTAGGTTLSATVPNTWTEVWHGDPGDNEVLTKVVTDADLTVWRTTGLAGTDLTWAKDYTKQLWQYLQATYGGLAGQKLHAVFHEDPGLGGTARVLFDAETSHRNMVDFTGDGWTSATEARRDIIAHEIGHVVESSAHDVHGSPAFGIWGDSKWCEIFQYDVYLALGLTAHATRWYDEKTTTVDDFPRAGTRWFRDWFHPIYRDHGGAATLDRFFLLLSTHFHRFDGGYARELNWGEFVHFWSGAAGTDLKPLATAAFGWPAEWQAQYLRAQQDYPGVTY